jgi:hypothetical protein
LTIKLTSHSIRCRAVSFCYSPGDNTRHSNFLSRHVTPNI